MSLGVLEGVKTFFTIGTTKERQQSKHNFELTCLLIARTMVVQITYEKHPSSARNVLREREKKAIRHTLMISRA